MAILWATGIGLPGCQTDRSAAREGASASLRWVEQRLEVLGIDAEGATVGMRGRLPVGSGSSRVQSASYTLEVEGQAVAGGVLRPPRCTDGPKGSECLVPARFRWAQVSSMSELTTRRRALGLKVHGAVAVEGSYPLTYEVTGIISPPRALEISVVSASLKEAGILGARVMVGLKVRNPNGFDLGPGTVSYQVVAQGRVLASAEELPFAGVAAGREVERTLEVELSTLAALSLLPTGAGAAARTMDIELSGSLLFGAINSPYSVTVRVGG